MVRAQAWRLRCEVRGDVIDFPYKPPQHNETIDVFYIKSRNVTDTGNGNVAVLVSECGVTIHRVDDPSQINRVYKLKIMCLRNGMTKLKYFTRNDCATVMWKREGN
jgi:hypothetical protein